MSLYYVDPAAIGSATGADWTNAWTDLQTALDTVIAGDTVYCRGTQTLTVKIDVDGANGDSTNGLIEIIGVNASGTEDGTRFTLDGNSVALYCLDVGLALGQYYLWRNIEVKNATSHGLNGTIGASYNVIFQNCSFNNNGALGMETYWMNNGSALIQCVAYDNSQKGFGGTRGANVFFCCAHGNGQDGFDLGYLKAGVVGCLSYDNGYMGYGIVGSSQSPIVFNCIADNNGRDGFQFNATGEFFKCLIGCRSTNHTTTGYAGVDGNSQQLVSGWNYFENNDGDNIQAANILYSVPDSTGTPTDIEDQGDTNQGYTSTTPGAEDYNLRSDATQRRTAIQIPTS